MDISTAARKEDMDGTSGRQKVSIAENKMLLLNFIERKHKEITTW